MSAKHHCEYMIKDRLTKQHKQCDKSGLYDANGGKFCKRHAGQITKKVEKIPVVSKDHREDEVEAREPEIITQEEEEQHNEEIVTELEQDDDSHVEIKESAVIPANVKVELDKISKLPTTPPATPKTKKSKKKSEPTIQKPRPKKVESDEQESIVDELEQEFESVEETSEPEENSFSNKKMFFYIAMSALRLGEGVCLDMGVNVKGTCDDLIKFKETKQIMDELYYEVVPDDIEELPAWLKLAGLVTITGINRYEKNKDIIIKTDDKKELEIKSFKPVHPE